MTERVEFHDFAYADGDKYKGIEIKSVSDACRAVEHRRLQAPRHGRGNLLRYLFIDLPS